MRNRIVSSIFLWPILLLMPLGCARVGEMRDSGNAALVKTRPNANKQTASGPKRRAPDISPQSSFSAQMEEGVWKRINALRQKNGLPPLERNAALTKIARAYSRRMSRERFFSHYDSQGKSAADRVRAAGVSYRVVGENLFLSRNAPNALDGAVAGWMKSTDHRVNILTQNYQQTGVGIWKRGRTYYFTQLFIQPS